MRLGIVSTFLQKCGVSAYNEELSNHLSKLCELKLFAEETLEEQPPLDSSIVLPYERCYKRGETYDKMLSKILEYKPDVVHIQFESSMYNESYQPESPFLKFLDNLHLNRIKTCITLHNVLPFPNFTSEEVQNISSWYKSLNSKLIVGNEAMRNEFLKWAPNAKVNVIPLGSPIFTSVSFEEALEKLKMPKDKIYIVQTGFWGADKGMVQLVKLLPELLKFNPQIQLAFAGGLHPMAPEAWKIHVRETIREIIRLGLTKNVTLLGKFVPEEEVNLWLGLASIVMLNYHPVSGLYSASASGKRVLCANRPIIMNVLDVRLSEFTNDVNCCKGNDENMLTVIEKCLTDKVYCEKIALGALEYAHKTRFSNIVHEHMKIYGESINVL